MFEPKQFEPRQIELPPCRWMSDNGVCLLDGLVCDGGCESFEPKPF